MPVDKTSASLPAFSKATEMCNSHAPAVEAWSISLDREPTLPLILTASGEVLQQASNSDKLSLVLQTVASQFAMINDNNACLAPEAFNINAEHQSFGHFCCFVASLCEQHQQQQSGPVLGATALTAT
eukprot:4713252-Amphidinium_carterae.1